MPFEHRRDRSSSGFHLGEFGHTERMTRPQDNVDRTHTASSASRIAEAIRLALTDPLVPSGWAK
jgi:hypothetical protein